MKINYLIIIILTTLIFNSCEEKVHEPSTREVLGGWLVVSENRLLDGWTQSDQNGITTDFEILNPFGSVSSGMAITSIKFNDDQTFFWNIDKVEDWEHFINWQPEDPNQWKTYEHDNDGITLYTPFEYVGIIKIDTTHFQISINKDDQLILENEKVLFKLTRID